jgi:hypothetical protein
VRIGFDDGPALEASLEPRTPALADQLAPFRARSRSAGVPPWALLLLVALGLVLVLVVLGLLVL